MADEQNRKAGRERGRDRTSLSRWLNELVRSGRLPPSKEPCPNCECPVGMGVLAQFYCARTGRMDNNPTFGRAILDPGGRWITPEVCAACGTLYYPGIRNSAADLVDAILDLVPSGVVVEEAEPQPATHSLSFPIRIHSVEEISRALSGSSQFGIGMFTNVGSRRGFFSIPRSLVEDLRRLAGQRRWALNWEDDVLDPSAERITVEVVVP